MSIRLILWTLALSTYGTALSPAVHAQIVTGWDSQGVPDNLVEDHPISSETLAEIRLALPEGVDVRSQTTIR